MFNLFYKNYGLLNHGDDCEKVKCNHKYKDNVNFINISLIDRQNDTIHREGY